MHSMMLEMIVIDCSFCRYPNIYHVLLAFCFMPYKLGLAKVIKLESLASLTAQSCTAGRKFEPYLGELFWV